MKRTTGISWARKTWNPVHGCTNASEGCKFCYALELTYNKEHGDSGPDGKGTPFKGMNLTYLAGDEKRWTGNIILTDDEELLHRPLHWKTPTLVFVNSMADAFHEKMEPTWIRKILSVCGLADLHHFQILTKRSHIMRKYEMPPNVIAGVSIENDRWVNRADDLRALRGAKKFISLEPLIGPVPSLDLTGIDQVVVGGESGPNFRPMELEWVEEILAKCRQTGTAFYVKQDAGRFPGRPGRFEDERPDLWLHEWPEPGTDEHRFRSLVEAMEEEKASIAAARRHPVASAPAVVEGGL